MYNSGLNERTRLRKQSEIIALLKDIIDKDPQGTATAMLNAALAVIAKVHPAKLDDEAKAKIKENYPSANAALMAERAMSEQGVLEAAYLGLNFALIALDYSPLSHGRAYVDSDVQLQEQMAHFRSQCAAVFAAGLSSGISPLGVGTIMTLIAADCASDQGISKFTILKSLVDMLMTLVEQDPLSDDPNKFDREEVVKDTLSALLKSHTKH